MSHVEAAESPRAPISSEKYVIASPRVAVFKGKKGTPHSNDLSPKNQTFSADFVFTRAEESDTSIPSLPSQKRCNQEEMYDYLPKDQIPTLESDETVTIPIGEKSESHCSIRSDRESTSSTVHPCDMSNIQDSGRNSFVGHERGRSRGLLAEFYDKIGRSRHTTEDIAIQVGGGALRYALLMTSYRSPSPQSIHR